MRVLMLALKRTETILLVTSIRPVPSLSTSIPNTIPHNSKRFHLSGHTPMMILFQYYSLRISQNLMINLDCTIQDHEWG
jgi:hypothetical protein